MSVFHETLHAYAAAISALDPGAFAACFAPDCELNDPVGAPPHRGQEGARAMLAGFEPLLASIRFQIGRIHLNGRSAALTWSIEAEGKNGRTASAEGIDVVDFDEAGKIVRTNGYWDPGPFVGALTA
jgi:limonene-1,2-epoxide hydrolase